MPETTYTMEQYNILSAAIAQGVVTVKYADKEITYRTLKEMEAIQYKMAVDLKIRTATPTRKVASFTKGLR